MKRVTLGGGRAGGEVIEYSEYKTKGSLCHITGNV